MGQYHPDDPFPRPRAGGAAQSVVGVEAAANQRRVAYATWRLEGAPARRVSRRDVAPMVNGHCPHGISSLDTEGGIRPRRLPELHLSIHYELLRGALLNARRTGERNGSFAHKEHRLAFQDAPGKRDGVLDGAKSSHCSRLEIGAFHQACIQLYLSFQVQDGSCACIESRIVLHHPDGSLNGV